MKLSSFLVTQTMHSPSTLPSEDSCIRLVAAVLVEAHENWSERNYNKVTNSKRCTDSQIVRTFKQAEVSNDLKPETI